ncbi:hypothetical protein Q3G72_006556 [Acer saccharum]|nr:hypothetical protein Q3G72_006556 [Acer saccharum]
MLYTWDVRTYLERFGCFDDIPYARINEAGSTNRAMKNLGLVGRKIDDLTNHERLSLNAEGAYEIGLHLIKTVQGRKKKPN